MNVKDELLLRLAKSGDDYISGGELAQQLGVSRNAVWKAVRSLIDDGYKIESVTAKGYRLSQENDRISAELISARNTAAQLGKEIIVLSDTDSTNNDAKKLASQGAVHGTAVISDTQSAGKGRLGRSFVSPPGKGLYMSVIIRPEFEIELAPLITSAAAVAAAEAVEDLCGKDVNIKWVNDLYMNGRKICGILTEASLGVECRSLDYAVIGIGINVREYDFGDELRSRVTSIQSETGCVPDRNELCAAVLSRLEYYLDNLKTRSHLDGYRRRELLTGNMITADAGLDHIRGKAIGIDDNANLIIEYEDGTRRCLSSGEANLCRIASR